jgi:hypothetical protein
MRCPGASPPSHQAPSRLGIDYRVSKFDYSRVLDGLSFGGIDDRLGKGRRLIGLEGREGRGIQGRGRVYQLMMVYLDYVYMLL